ncbi:uncharacterized protein LOC117315399 [Pecten maximus]|uniref:uncharacterized protein LOC117315399 n=1 Tax=Pecten maximus TaxID=6579 RepID=UPI001458B5A1|nr:uncharacterized protein LOC117315399 [Pecten maximus]
MKTFKQTKNSLMCSDHFVDRAGPSPVHPIPSLFGSKIFKTSKLDENLDIESEVVINMEEESDLNSSNSSNSSFELAQGFVTSESILDTSLRVHDYFGQTDSDRSTIRNQYVQTEATSITVETQTDDASVSFFKDVGCQTVDIECVDASEQVCLPLLTYDDIKYDDQKILFYTGIPDSDTFKALYDEVKDDAEERTARGSNSTHRTGSGGRPRILRVVDEFFYGAYATETGTFA